jgi:tRNA threonylcarbamoyladenosine biosynthesis protein TsaB
MKGPLLALDTSCPSGFVAVGDGRRVLARARLDRKGQHASRLLPAIHRVLQQAGTDASGLVGVVVGEGPGSFTGVRVAAATAKGLARGLGVPLFALSSLAAGAVADLAAAAAEAAEAEGAAGGTGAGAQAPAHRDAWPGASVRYVLFDARGDRVYAACYGVGTLGVETLIPPHAGDLRTLLAGDLPAGAVFAGDGAQRHRGAIEGAGYRVLAEPAGEPTADALLYLRALHADMLPVPSLETWEPRYVKASSAEGERVA